MVKFESSVKTIPHAQERVYEKLSNLNNLESVKDKLPLEKVKDFSFDADRLSFRADPVGQLTLSIVERTPCKCVKFASENSPLPFNLWIQIVPVADEECKIKITVGAEVNPFVKAMVQKPIQEGIERMADLLARINY